MSSAARLSDCKHMELGPLGLLVKPGPRLQERGQRVP